MKKTYHFSHANDLYEISMQGYVITRITCYLSGQHRQDMQYDDVPKDVQDKILAKVEQALNAL